MSTAYERAMETWKQFTQNAASRGNDAYNAIQAIDRQVQIANIANDRQGACLEAIGAIVLEQRIQLVGTGRDSRISQALAEAHEQIYHLCVALHQP